jgi:hypothetical protein
MRLRIAFLVVAATVIATTGAGAHGAMCGPAKARTLAADRVARVYSVRQKVYGCARGSHSRYLLGATSNSMSRDRVGPLALAGYDVAFGRRSYGVDVVSAEVVVEYLVDGRVLRDRRATDGDYGPETFEQINSIVVKPDGAVAWIATDSTISGAKAIEARKSDHTKQTYLDSGPKVRPQSLRLHGSKLTWRDGSTTKSASLR